MSSAVSLAKLKIDIPRLFLIASFLFCMYILAINSRSSGALNFFLDHLKHMRFAWEFLRIGVFIYVTPMKNLEVIGDPAAHIWPEFPYVYPLGSVLLYLPFASLVYLHIVPQEIVYKFLIAFFLLFAHIDTYLLYEKLSKNRVNKLINFLFCAVFYLSILLFSFVGQYESIVLFFMILAAYTKRIDNYVFFLSFATFLKFQALLILPFYLLGLYLSCQEYGREIYKNKYIIASLAILIINFINILFIRGAICPIMDNPIYYKNLSLQLIASSIMTIGVCIYAARAGRSWERYLLISSLVFSFVCLSSLCQFAPWYLLFMYPMALYFKYKENQEIYIFYMILFLYLIERLENIYYVTDLFINVLQNR